MTLRSMTQSAKGFTVTEEGCVGALGSQGLLACLCELLSASSH